MVKIKAKLKQELMLKELEVQVIALVATTMATALAVILSTQIVIQAWKLIADKDDIISEIFSKVMSLTF